MFNKIIVPLDGSELAEAALPAATAIQERFGAQLILVRVIEPESRLLAQAPGLFEGPGSAAASVEIIQEMVEQERKEASEYLEAQKARYGAEIRLVEGTAADSIVFSAQESGADLIVMSSHGRGGLARLVLGSVTDAVLRNSSVPVLLVRNPNEHLKDE